MSSPASRDLEILVLSESLHRVLFYSMYIPFTCVELFGYVSAQSAYLHKYWGMSFVDCLVLLLGLLLCTLCCVEVLIGL